ncbi:MAG TPA: murein biosynthesis integral membrane protein MurJ [Candidatus Saccharimonadia bacterium]|nr:murein biosynthesis integral membrane protein MurJ [Candidatus Saccharimonadia bacterium]
MVDRAKHLLGRANAGQTVASATLIISGAYLLSRILGLLRNRLLAAHFGLGPDLSAYNAAFRLPDLLFTLLVSGAFAVAFIPVLSRHLEQKQQDEAWRVTSSLLNLLVLITIAGGVVIVVFADPLMRIMAPGFDAHTHELATGLTRILAITPVLFAVSSVLGSVQQAFNRFLIYSFSGVLYNVGIIVGIIAFVPHLGVYGAAWGVVLGVITQALLQWLGLHGLGFKYRPVISLRLAGVRQTLGLMLPRSIDQGLDQINYTVETVIGSTISASAIAQFAYANDLKNVPLVLIGSSITTAVFPRLAARAAEGQREQLIEAYVKTARLILFLAIPSALFAVVARGYIVRLLYGFGDLDTATTLGWFAGTIVFTSLFMLVSRVYYAMQNTRTPLYLSLASIPLNIALSIWLGRVYGVAGLAMSASIVAVLETLALVALLRHGYGRFGEKSIMHGVWRMVVAAAIMLGALYPLIAQIMPLYADDRGFLTLMPKFALIVAVALLTYLVPCYALRLNEARHFATRAKELLARSLSLT